MENRIIYPGERYRHFKGGVYQIITIAKDERTGEPLVIYQALYGDFEVYARPMDLFLSVVDKKKYPDTLQKMRFEKIEGETKVTTGTKKVTEMKTPSDVKMPEKEAKQQQTQARKQEEKETEKEINPDLLAFLDAQTYREKMNVMVGMRNRLDEHVLLSIAASMDLGVEKESTKEEYFETIVAYIRTRARFER